MRADLNYAYGTGAQGFGDRSALRAPVPELTDDLAPLTDLGIVARLTCGHIVTEWDPRPVQSWHWTRCSGDGCDGKRRVVKQFLPARQP